MPAGNPFASGKARLESRARPAGGDALEPEPGHGRIEGAALAQPGGTLPGRKAAGSPVLERIFGMRLGRPDPGPDRPLGQVSALHDTGPAILETAVLEPGKNILQFGLHGQVKDLPGTGADQLRRRITGPCAAFGFAYTGCHGGVLPGWGLS